MASFINNPENWRLHSNNGIVPLKYTGIEGEFQPQQGELQFKCVIQATSIKEFLLETFPPQIKVGNIFVPQSAGLPGLPAMTATKVTFKAQDDGLPIDPFGFDLDAPAGTYNRLIEVVVTYGMNRLQQPDPSNPFSFLEISGNHTGDYLSTTAPAGKWQLTTGKNIPVKKPDGTSNAPGASNTPANPRIPGTTEPVADPTVPIVITVPECEWTVKWNQIPFEYFRDVLIYRLRWCIGRVNSDLFPVLFNLEPETLLFLGWNYTQSYTWRDGEIDTPPVSIEMKFKEKRLIWNENVIGHNHVWRPGKGWEYMLIDGGQPVHNITDLNVLFQIG